MPARVRSLLAASAVAVASIAGAAPAPAAIAVAPRLSDEPAWRWPVARPIVVDRPFRAPATPYGAGHRGIDLAVATGAPVSAPADGVVAFAGMVAGRGVVTIDHGRGVLSSYEPVAASVDVGDPVRAGGEFGTLATGDHCDECLHLGVRVDGEYVSPFVFLGGVPRAVLLPWRDD